MKMPWDINGPPSKRRPATACAAFNGAIVCNLINIHLMMTAHFSHCKFRRCSSFAVAAAAALRVVLI
jgi:hypothetical protein